MSLNLPSRRVVRAASTTLCPSSSAASSLIPALQSLNLGPSPSSALSLSLNRPQRRHAWFGGRKSKKAAAEQNIPNPKQLTQGWVRERLIKHLTYPEQGNASIFADELNATPKEVEPSVNLGAKSSEPKGAAGASLLRDHLSRATDPDPRSRVRWQRKMVLRHATSATDPFSREPRAARLARTERRMLYKSLVLPTSVKKLVHLAHQIQGKTVADALEQMRYSKKKMAREVRAELEVARDRAIAERGMGLGRVGGATEAPDEVAKVQTKDGQWVTIDDPTRMYVAEAWVGRGPWRGFKKDYRARGRMNIMKRPSTSISVVLKEEKTRIREHQEREAKKYRQGPWVHLPDRPVTAQRQYYSW